LRYLLLALLLLLVGLQYRLWFAEGGRLELARLKDQSVEYERENARLRERNAELTRQVLDLKSGQVVLEQRAREELGLTGEDEIYYQFVSPEEAQRLQRSPAMDEAALGDADAGPGAADEAPGDSAGGMPPPENETP
jgi:cell division protein FtsB